MGTVVSRHPPHHLQSPAHQHHTFCGCFLSPSIRAARCSLIHNKGLGNLLSIPFLHEWLLSSVQDFSSFISIYNCNCNCYNLVCAAHGASVGTVQGAGGGSVWRMGLPWSQPVISSCSPPAPARPAVTQTRGIETLSISWLRNTELMRLSTKVGMNSCTAGAWCMEAGW